MLGKFSTLRPWGIYGNTEMWGPELRPLRPHPQPHTGHLQALLFTDC
jgi:hypothetical protein